MCLCVCVCCLWAIACNWYRTTSEYQLTLMITELSERDSSVRLCPSMCSLLFPSIHASACVWLCLRLDIRPRAMTKVKTSLRIDLSRGPLFCLLIKFSRPINFTPICRTFSSRVNFHEVVNLKNPFNPLSLQPIKTNFFFFLITQSRSVIPSFYCLFRKSSHVSFDSRTSRNFRNCCRNEIQITKMLHIPNQRFIVFVYFSNESRKVNNCLRISIITKVARDINENMGKKCGTSG